MHLCVAHLCIVRHNGISGAAQTSNDTEGNEMFAKVKQALTIAAYAGLTLSFVGFMGTVVAISLRVAN